MLWRSVNKEKRYKKMSLIVSSQHYAHSHPNEDNPIPSNDDRRTLKIIHQKNSIIVSATTGRVVEYSQNQFELGGVLYVDN